MKISAMVLTKNEEKNIERCLKSLDFCDEIIIVDDYSTDKTIEIINNVGNKNLCSVHKRQLNNDFAQQRNFGLSKANNEWILFVDADEEVSKELKKEIVSLFHGSIVKENAFYLRRIDYFWNHELKFGEIKKVRIRLLKKNSGTWMGNVHEEFRIKNSKLKIAKLNNYINHYPHPTLKEFISDVNNYSSIRAEELFNRGTKTNVFEIIFLPFGKFIYNYFFNLGFLDGAVGFTYSFMMSFHSFLVRSKLYQLTNKQ